ncbi:MAG: PAS domain S-box protein [Paracoccaceae bacterium]|nr:MAG: PAS domain S-box protein [Paracoccaceae bacterium]
MTLFDQFNGNVRNFFDVIPTPMWIFDRETLAIRDANRAVCTLLGYGRDELCTKTIADLRPPPEAEAIWHSVARFTPPEAAGGRWHLRHRCGTYVLAQFHWQAITHLGRPSILATIHDLSAEASLESERQDLLDTTERLRREAEIAARQFQNLFESLPGRFLVLTADPASLIVTASNNYLDVTMTRREDIVGRSLYEVFPDDPEDPDADGTEAMRQSLAYVVSSGVPDAMGIRRYPIPRPAALGGGFEERYWSIINAPLHDSTGKVGFIIHRVEDVTDFVRQYASTGTLNPDLATELLTRTRELQSANDRLKEVGANLRTAQRLMKLGLWRLNVETGAVWTSGNFDHPVEIDHAGRSTQLDRFFQAIHAEDRERTEQELKDFIDGDAKTYGFEFRTMARDGTIRHLRGAGEKTETDAGRFVTGVVQDVTETVQAGQRLDRASQLIQIAGSIVRVGGWYLDLERQEFEWTSETAIIHGFNPDHSPTIDEAVELFIPSDRPRIRELVSTCVRDGTAYDEVMHIVRQTGEEVPVRAVGRALRNADGRIVGLYGAMQDITELVAIHDRNEELRLRLLRAFESMGDSVYIIDRDGRLEYVNAQAERSTGAPRASLIGRSMEDVFPPAAHTPIREAHARAVADGAAVRIEQYLPEPLDRWQEITIDPGEDSFAVYVRDVTRDRQQTEKLRLMEAAVSHLSDAVTISELSDAPGGPVARIVHVNAAFERRTGFDRAEVIGKTSAIRHGPETDTALARAMQAAVSLGRAARGELVVYSRNGQPTWIETELTPILGADGTPTHCVAVDRDISSRKLAEEVLRVSEQRFRLVAEATNEAIIDLDATTDRVWSNERMFQLFGYRAGDLAATESSWFARIHPDDRHRVRSSFEAAVASDTSSWTETYRYRRADGSFATIQHRGTLVRAPDGKMTRFVSLIDDQTETIRATEHLREAQKLEALGQLTGGIAHDFNNLLTIILGNAELLSEQITDPRLRRMAEQSVTAAERGAELTSRLLSFARQQPLAPKVFDLGAFLLSMKPLLRRALTEDVEIDFAIPAEKRLAEVDPGQLELAILNLAINARDAMPDGGKLTVGIADKPEAASAPTEDGLRMGDYVELYVADEGHGMTQEVLERAFEPFFTTKPDGTGSGLGLSMVYGFVKQSGGHVEIRTTPGAGCTVRLFLPAVLEPVRDAASSVGGSTEAPSSRRILVVEDDEFVREHVMQQLRSLGYVVVTAEDGNRAISYLQTGEAVDLLLTDVVMPGGINGRALAETARRLRPGIRVLFTSGYTEDALMQNDRLAPGTLLLSKPYRRNDLARMVAVALDTRPDGATVD